MRNTFKLLLLVMLLSSPIFAYSLTIKSTVSQGTLAVGTNVTLVKEGVELYSAKADSKGLAHFNVSEGSYFVLLNRAGYALHVNLLEVSSDKLVEYNLRQLISYASAYGVITGPPSFQDTYVRILSDGKLYNRVSPNNDGYYIVQFLPEGNYELVFESPGFANKSVEAYLKNADFTEISVELSRPQSASPTEPEGEVSLVAPEAVALHSIIEVSLFQGGVPLSGRAIGVITPSGETVLMTDGKGKATINAAEEGEYSFSYQGAVKVSIVPSSKPSQPAQVEPGPSEPSAPAPSEQPAQPQGLGGAAIILLAMGAIFFVAIVLLVLVFVFRKLVHANSQSGEQGTPKEAKSSGAAAQSTAGEAPGPKEAQAKPASLEKRHRKRRRR